MNQLFQHARQSVAVALVGSFALAAAANAKDVSEWVWNDPKTVEIPGVKHHTIESPSMKRTVGFNVYLPPQYETEPDRRFPVVYFLHGSGGTETSDAGVAYQVDGEIRAGNIAPVIYVFPNGGAESKYRDWEDQNVKSETLIMKELIPRVDAEFRTINDGRQRGICGFSMGGGGALRLALKYPEQFCGAVSLAAAFDEGIEGHDGDNVFVYAKENQEAIRNSVALSLVVGSEDYLQKRHPAFLSLLTELEIKHAYRQLDDVGHNFGLYSKISGGDMVRFLASRCALGGENIAKEEAELDRVGFPEKYSETYEVLRSIYRSEIEEFVTVFGNRQAASITDLSQLPYPYGSSSEVP